MKNARISREYLRNYCGDFGENVGEVFAEERKFSLKNARISGEYLQNYRGIFGENVGKIVAKEQ